MKKILNLSCLLFALGLLLSTFPALAATLLWQAEHGTQKIWLLGSIHLGRADLYPLPAAIERAYREADTVALETVDSFGDDQPEAARLWAKLALLPPQQKLPQFLTPEQQAKLQDLLADDSLLSKSGMNAAQFQQLRPWAAWVMLDGIVPAQQAGLGLEYGIDLHFYNQAKADGKQLVGLETTQSQLELFAAMRDSDAAILFAELLDPKVRAENNAMLVQAVNAWQRGDLRQLRKLSDMDDGSEIARQLSDTLLKQRNRAMLEKIIAMAGSPAPLIVVGSAHLLGKDNLLDMLRKRGFTLKRY